jgi:hypothetical protein
MEDLLLLLLLWRDSRSLPLTSFKLRLQIFLSRDSLFQFLTFQISLLFQLHSPHFPRLSYGPLSRQFFLGFPSIILYIFLISLS